MIVTKIFKFDSKNIDSTIIDIAKEIERGYTVVSITPVDNCRMYEVTLMINDRNKWIREIL